MRIGSVINPASGRRGRQASAGLDRLAIAERFADRRHGVDIEAVLTTARPLTGGCSWWLTRLGAVAMAKRSVSSARAARAAANAPPMRRRIDYSDLPEAEFIRTEVA